MSTHENEVYGRIKVKNPFTGEYEEGELTEDGVFIGDQVDFGDVLHPSELEPRVMLLGRSSIKNFCKIGNGSIINSANIFHSNLGRNVRVDEGAGIYGGDPIGRVFVDDDVTIGRNSFISGKSTIGRRVKVGNNVTIEHSFLQDESVIKSGSNPLSGGHLTDQTQNSKRTYVSGSTIGEDATVGSDAVVINTHVFDGNIVGPESYISNPRRSVR